MVDPVRLDRREFVSSLSSASLDVATLQADSRMAGVDVAGADLDGDGQIGGARELRALFDRVDRLDRDGNDARLLLVGRDGQATASAAPIAAIGDLGRAAALQRKARSAEPGNDDVIFIGMRTETRSEADALSRRGRAAGYSVQAIGGTSSTVNVGSQRFDLSNDAGCRSFANSLGLPQAQADRVYDAIRSNPVDGRDELAQLAVVLARGETGGTIPSRLVISGHHAGGTFFGDRGNLSDRAVMDLARALPRGAGQIEDIHLAGCYSHGRSTLDGWREAFPNMQSVWGYGHTAPAAGGGAEAHEAAWDSATRGRVGILDRTAARGTHSAEVIVWSRQGGFQSGEAQRPIADVRRDVSAGASSYDDALAGRTTISDPHSGAVRDYYSALNDLLEHPDLPAADRPAIEDRRDRAIRLLYFRDVERGWATENQSTLAAAYGKIGQPVPDFSTMSRATALRTIDDFLTRTQGSTDPAVVAARARMTELRDLDPKAIRLDWIR